MPIVRPPDAGSWKTTSTDRPATTRSSVGAANDGGSTGVTSTVETTARWSVGQGRLTMSVYGPPSPTTRLWIGVIGPAVYT